MKEFDKEIKSTFAALNEVQKKRDAVIEEHNKRMEEIHNELRKITSSTIDLSDMETSHDEFMKRHQEIESDLDQMSKDLDDLLNDDVFNYFENEDDDDDNLE